MAVRALARLNVLSLCSGVGGLDLGIVRAAPGVSRTVGMVERDAYAAATLVARMVDKALDPAPVWDDLATFDGRSWRGAVDLVAAGYPCQPFSHAGLQRGVEDPRHLWPHVARIVHEVEPAFVFLENVRQHVRVGFDQVLEDLALLGFNAEWDLFSAASVGAPHRRERLFVLAWRVSDAGGDALRELAERIEQDEAQREDALAAHVGGPVAHGGRVGQPIRCVAHDDDRDHGAGDQPHVRDPVVGHAMRAGLQGPGPSSVTERRFPPGPGDRRAWDEVAARRPDLEPAVRRVAHGAANVMDNPMAFRVDRLRCLGNAVVPDQAARALRELVRRAAGREA